MTSYQASLWREMAKEAAAAADRVRDPGVRREIWSMAARYMAMAKRVEQWTVTDRSRIDPDEANGPAPDRSS
jgi:hypothetical protein